MALGTTTTCTPAETRGLAGAGHHGPAGRRLRRLGGRRRTPAARRAAGGTASGGGLAATGAEDNGTLRALGLVAGTAILLGGAVFTFTPWRRLRGTR